MTTRRLIVLALVLGLLIPITAAAAPSTSPLPSAGLRDFVTGPCTAGAAYNPACDVDHNGVIDVLDIQLAAGHWNQSGAFTSGSWDLVGNAGTTPGANFLGTTDNQALEVKVNGARALRIEPGMDVPNLIGGSAANVVTSGVRGATIAGGGRSNALNQVTDDWGTVGGGAGNQAGGNSGSLSEYATVAGGIGNEATAYMATVSGGSGNAATGQYAFVGGGLANDATATHAVITAGSNNSASGTFSAVLGGFQNSASGDYAVVSGGSRNTAAGSYSFAAGRRAKANNTGAFVLADSSDFDFTPVVPNSFTARFTGGARFVLGIDGAGANTWLCAVYNGGSWGCSSDRNVKENFQPVDGRDVLQKLMTVPITTWNAIGTDPNVRRMGPMSQDFYAAFGLGDDDKVITTGDLDGVALASIQGLYQIVQEKDVQLAAQQQQIDTQQARLDEQQAQIEKLIARLTALEQGSTTAP